MKVAIGSDHAGLEAKSALAAAVKEMGHEAEDMGPFSTAAVDYPDFARKTAERVSSGKADLGILVCGTGIGMSMAANKVAGVRAAVCHDEYTARMSRRHNDANVLCLGARLLAVPRMADLARIFLSESFEGGRHCARVNKIEKAEG